MKRILCSILVLLSAISLLAGCSSPPSAPAAAIEPESQAAPSNMPEEDPEDNPYDLDFNLADVWQPMSDVRLTQEGLLSLYNEVKAPKETDTYADVVEKMGCDASRFKLTEGKRYFGWLSEENESQGIQVIFAEVDGKWLNSTYSKSV